LARATALATYVLAAATAAALANPLGWLLFALALTPGVLLRASCNSSALLAHAQALLLLALVVRLAASACARADSHTLTRDAERRSALALILLGAGSAVCDAPSLVLFPFLASLALEHVPARRRWLLLATALLCTCLMIAAQWRCDPRPLVPPDSSLAERLTWPLQHPARAWRMLRRTIFRRGDEAWLELAALPAALTQQLRFVGTFVATLHGQLLFALSAGALRAVLPPGRASILARAAMLAALLYTLAVGIHLVLAEPQLRPPVLEGFTGVPFFPALLALSLALASGAPPLAARWLTRRPIVRIVLPLILLHAYCLTALTARFHLAPTLPFPY
jgi:hypothetical protein